MRAQRPAQQQCARPRGGKNRWGFRSRLGLPKVTPFTAIVVHLARGLTIDTVARSLLGTSFAVSWRQLCERPFCSFAVLSFSYRFNFAVQICHGIASYAAPNILRTMVEVFVGQVQSHSCQWLKRGCEKGGYPTYRSLCLQGPYDKCTSGLYTDKLLR